MFEANVQSAVNLARRIMGIGPGILSASRRALSSLIFVKNEHRSAIKPFKVKLRYGLHVGIDGFGSIETNGY
jgi:hypothetical protein